MADVSNIENENSGTCHGLTGDSSAVTLSKEQTCCTYSVNEQSDQTSIPPAKNGFVLNKEQCPVSCVSMSSREQVTSQVICQNDRSVKSTDGHRTATVAHDISRKDESEMEGVDSGVHSGTENGSDGKSSSSSPGLSTESSIHDLSDKLPLDKRLSAEHQSTNTDTSKTTEDDPDKQMDQLADNIAKSLMVSPSNERDIVHGIDYVVYESELQMPDIMRLITKDLSEPYSIYTYRYFIHNWPKLCFLAMSENECVGAIVCKLDMHKKMVRRGYIAMLAIDQNCRRKGIGSHLVLKAISAMIADDCDEVVLETEITNKAALRLYENLGFVRDKRLFRYYLNGVDALRLKLWLR